MFSVSVVFLALPMATVLLVVPVLVLGRHGGQSRRPFLVGFEVVGWTVLTVLVAACWLTSPVNGFIAETIRQNPYAHAIHGLVVIVLFTMPQLVIADARSVRSPGVIPVVVERETRRSTIPAVAIGPPPG